MFAYVHECMYVFVCVHACMCVCTQVWLFLSMLVHACRYT